MKRTAIAVGVFLAIFFLVSSASAVTWYTYREDIAIGSGYADIDLVYNLSYSGAPANASGNITLPCNIGNLSAMNFSVYNDAGTNATYNLTANGVGLNSSSWTNITLTNWTSLANYVSAGGSETVTYINWSFNCTQTVSLNITIQGTDVTLDTTWLTTVLTIKEKDVTTPTVGMSQPASFWTVNNSFNMTSNLWIVNLSNAVFNITYPDHTVGTPSTTTFAITSLAANGTDDQYVQYQKRGPYVYDVEEDIDGRSHEVIIKLSCQELLTNIVDWTVDPDDEKYDDAFDTLNFDTLDVELNGVDKDWDQDGDNIELEEFTVFPSIAGNKWVFTWTVPAPVVPVVEEPWDVFVAWMTTNWLWLLGGGIAVIGIVAGVYIYASEASKPRRKKK